MGVRVLPRSQLYVAADDDDDDGDDDDDDDPSRSRQTMAFDCENSIYVAYVCLLLNPEKWGRAGMVYFTTAKRQVTGCGCQFRVYHTTIPHKQLQMERYGEITKIGRANNWRKSAMEILDQGGKMDCWRLLSPVWPWSKRPLITPQARRR